MQVVKRASCKDVYPALQCSYDEVFDMLKSTLDKEDMLFAEPKKSVNEIQWVHPESGWICFDQADEFEQDAVRKKMEFSISHIKSIIDIHAIGVDDLFRIPGEEYIYFREDPIEKFSILITGWGYKKPKTVPVGAGSVRDPHEKTQRVIVEFIDDSVLVPNFDFEIIRANRNPLLFKTGSDGRTTLLENAHVGSCYKLRTAGGKEFILRVELGKEFYDFDVTEKKDPQPKTEKIFVPEPLAPLYVSPLLKVLGGDGLIMPDFPVEVTYPGNREVSYKTNSNGQVQLEELEVPSSICAEEAIEHLTRAEFDLTEESRELTLHVPFVVCSSHDIRIKTEDSLGRPFSGQIRFEQPGRPTCLCELDAQGQCWLNKDYFLIGEDIEANLSKVIAPDGYDLDKITFQLQPDETEYLLSLRVIQPKFNWWEVIAAVLGVVALVGLYLCII